MSLSTIDILSLVLALCGVVLSLLPRVPAVVASYAALVLAHFSAPEYIGTSTLVFWGIASAIVLGMEYLQPRTPGIVGGAYVWAGAVVGTMLGFLASPSAAAVIIGSAAGAFLGSVAFMRTPRGPRFSIGSRRFVDFLCSRGLPAVVCCAIGTIAAAVVLSV